MTTAFRNAHIYFLVLIPAILLGFWKTYFSILDNLPKTITPLIHIHTLMMLVWTLMLVGQAWFIRTRRLRIHRIVGRSSFVIAPLICLLALAVLHEAINRTPGGVPMDGPVGARLSVFGFGQVLAFAVSWVLAMLYRRQTPHHVRFIVSTAFAMSTAIVFRIFAMWVPGIGSIEAAVAGNCSVLIGLLLILIAIDWRNGLKRSPYWVVTIVLAVMSAGYWTYARTELWLAFCQWFADLPIRG